MYEMSENFVKYGVVSENPPQENSAGKTLLSTFEGNQENDEFGDLIGLDCAELYRVSLFFPERISLIKRYLQAIFNGLIPAWTALSLDEEYELTRLRIKLDLLEIMRLRKRCKSDG